MTDGITGHDLVGEDCERRRIARNVSCSGACVECGIRFEDGDQALVTSTVTKQRGRFIRDTVQRIIHLECAAVTRPDNEGGNA
jgi:hypothetical protein